MKKKPVVLIVDDEKNTREGLARALQRKHTVLLADNGQTALDLLDRHRVDIILSDIRMPGMDGMTLIRRALTRTPQPVCILLTAYGSIETAVEAMKAGAYDFLPKPVNLDKLDLLMERALRSRDMEDENRELKKRLDKKYGLENIIGQTPAMEQVFDQIRQVAPSRATVMIQGESGTGKELVAQAIHRLSPRLHGPYVAVHCAALPENLLESELFGHEKGAFTGAVGQRQGRFERADGGTLFLDEIGEISPVIQVKLLRVLEERVFERVGGEASLDVDVRLITATNRHLETMVAEGTFREDLFYRLHVVQINLPPLREHRDDIPLLAHHFLKQASKENGKDVQTITPEALDALTAHDWPGNVRELRNRIESMVVMCRSNKIGLRDLPADLRGGASSAPRGAGTSLLDTEKRLIADALRQHKGNKTKAAEQLGISRRTIHRKVKEYGLESQTQA
ncbi:MAG: sigma-54 dependent transcriptional regulator [Kiritimatiellae bacterium]|nr:sigma-54 dependent transcriptional regulator [Kiritimatiellia bacterium]MDD4734820.1 sigma-54 dependent transcriptional regulator [Kiritimatiellia bacterium]